ncbi:MAG: SPOR domain-containing protein [Spirosomataceae bacterium]
MKIALKLSPVFLLVVLAACSKTTTPSKTATSTTYDEDLASFRPKYAVAAPPTSVTPTKETPPPVKAAMTDQPLHINRRLDMVLDTIAMRNKAVKFANGFRIMLYVGNNRQEADNAKIFCYQTFPELNPYMTFTQPTYRVKIGDFMTRLDAERYFEQLKLQYPSALIINDKVDIKKSVLVK